MYLGTYHTCSILQRAFWQDHSYDLCGNGLREYCVGGVDAAADIFGYDRIRRTEGPCLLCPG